MTVNHLIWILFDVLITGTIAFVGSHLDVVPANPETWERNPFKLAVEVRVVYRQLCIEDQLSGIKFNFQ